MSDPDIVARLQVIECSDAFSRNLLNKACAEIERLRELSGNAGQLREERDDARREVCEWVAMMTRQKPSTAAKQRGWDCFKGER